MRIPRPAYKNQPRIFELMSEWEDLGIRRRPQ